jgi:phage tail sheath gpL-like
MAVNLPGIPSTFLTPGAYLQLSLGMGLSSVGADQRSIVVTAPMTSAGTYTPNTLYAVSSEDEVAFLSGEGSPLHRSVRSIMRSNKQANIYVLPYEETSGGGAVKADGYVDFTGSTATRSGQVRIRIAEDVIAIGFSRLEDEDVIAARCVDFINARTYLPVTASSTSGLLELEAKVAGRSQGDGTTGLIRVSVNVTPGSGVTFVKSGNYLGIGAGTGGSDGTESELSKLTAALATIENTRRYYIVSTCWHDDELEALQTHIANKSAPDPGLRSVGIAFVPGDMTAVRSKSNDLNYERMILVGQPQNVADAAYIAGNVAAVMQFEQNTISSYPLVNYRKAGRWHVPAVEFAGDRLSSNQINDAMRDGVTVIQSGDAGSYLVDVLSTKSKNDTGTVTDTRSLWNIRLSIGDEIGDVLLANHELSFSGWWIKPDDGTPPGPRTVTPSLYRNWLANWMQRFADENKIVNLDQTLEAMIVQIDPDNNRRMQVLIPFECINGFSQAVFDLQEISSN